MAYIKKCRPCRIVPKDASKAVDDISDAWGAVWKARGLMRSAQSAIGSPSKWSGDLAKLNELLLKVSIRLEDINDEIRELRRASKQHEEAQP